MHEMTVRVEVRAEPRDLESAMKVGMAALDAGTRVLVEQRRADKLRVVDDRARSH